MKSMKKSVVPGLIAAALVLPCASQARADWPVEHLDTVDFLASEIAPENNVYDEPSKIEFVAGQLRIKAVCGGFVAQLLKLSYPDVITADLLEALTGSTSPKTTVWYNAILDEREAVTKKGTYALRMREDADDIAPGDILASEYFKYGQTGHTMLVYAIKPATIVASTIPGYKQVRRYEARIIDSTKSVHNNQPGSTDTRYRSDVDAKGTTVNDTGFGSGDIYLYADPQTGDLIGWAWSLKQSVAYQGVDDSPSGSTGEYRPIVAGFISGPGVGPDAPGGSTVTSK